MNKILDLLKEKNYVNGKLNEYSGDKLSVTNPASIKTIGSIPSLSAAQIKEVIDITCDGFKTWSSMLPKERSNILYKWQNLIMENIDLLAEIVTLEHGKPLDEAKKEIIYGANFIGWFASKALDISGYITQGIKQDQKIIVEYEPVGPVCAITPWNFPSAMVTRKVSQALAAGCSIILKPSELTPFSALALGLLAKEAGIPNGVLNIITCDSSLFSDVICEDSRIRKISFTGSTRVGKILHEKSASTLKRLSLELGGNAPYIIFDDCDLEKAAGDLINAKIRSTGQSCTSPNRILIQSSIYSNFIKLVEGKLSKLVLGDGFNLNVTVGPLINKKSADRIESLIKDAKTKGAEIIVGGNIASHFINKEGKKTETNQTHSFFEPTLLINCNKQMDIFRDEIFGPVICCYKFKTEEEALSLANESEYGLASYIYTSNHSKAWDISNKLDYGIVGINESIISNEVGAFGGRKSSGYGIEGSELGIYEYLNTKYKCVNY